MKKLTVDQINSRIKVLFKGDVHIDWTKSGEYKTTKQRVIAVHKVFGEWEVLLDRLLAKRNHPSAQSKYHSKEALDKDIKKIHKGLVSINWDKTLFPVRTKDLVFAVDSEYGEWQIKLYGLLRGEGHKQRYYDSKKLNQEEINKRVQDIFNGKVSIIWDKPYIKRKSKIKAIDSHFGEWITTIDLLLRGINHPQRGRNITRDKKRLTIKEIDARIEKLHKGKVFIDWTKNPTHEDIKNKVVATDIDYGNWKVELSRLLQGAGHKERFLAKKRHSCDSINSKINKLFKNKVTINWAKSGTYKNSSQHIIAVHKEKGEWRTTVAKLLEGHNHPELGGNQSKGERQLISWLKRQKIKVKTQKLFKVDGKTFELDILLPEYNLAIEFNGIYFHCELFKDKNYHENKRLMSKNIGFDLIQIYETEWSRKPDLVKNLILSKTKNQPSKIDFKPIDKSSLIKELPNKSLPFNSVKNSYQYLEVSNDSKSLGFIGFSNQGTNIEVHFNTTHIFSKPFLSSLETYFIKNYDSKSIKIMLDHRLETESDLILSGFNKLETKITHIWTNLKHLYPKKIKARRILKIYEPGKSLLIKNL